MTFEEWKQGKPDMVLLSTAEDAYDAGQNSCACCGACIYWDNIALAGERWACVHPEKDLKSEINDVCDFFLPRGRK